ncbi:TonB protein [hydrothermal vent metagenome]|uniref:TonB protein n=1 Tax=hydrothermal vent metagenome TaxID=652676 RepID=A0A3B1AKQ2_9ZZZZ
MTNTAVINPFDRLGLTLFFAGSLHIALILGVGFTFTSPSPPSATSTLEIMVVHNARKPKEPEKADFLAPVSQEGSGNQEEVIKPTMQPIPQSTPDLIPEPLIPTPTLEPEPAPAAAPTQEPAPPPPQKIIAATTSPKQLTPPPEQQPLVKKRKRLSAAQLLTSTNLEIKRLSAELDLKTQRFAKRPRRKAINASTKEYKYAAYLGAWRRKIERIGNINYPDEARRQKLYGNLVLHVAVQADGSVKKNGIQLLHSSGHKVLDDAAIRIVRMAAPYAPFPANIRKETDILDITRTWRFLSNNSLGWKK